MRAGTSFSAVEASGSRRSAEPVVFVDGVPAGELAVSRARESAPLGVIEVELRGEVGTHLGRDAVVVLPRRLSDGSLRWEGVAAGRIEAVERAVRVGRARLVLKVVDRWAEELARAAEPLWELDAMGGLLAADSAMLGVGAGANRATERVYFEGQLVYLPQAGGEPWTVGEALATVGVLRGLAWQTDALPKAVREAPLASTLDLGGDLTAGLGRLMKMQGLYVQREKRWVGERWVERRVVRAAEQGRRITLPAAAVRSIEAERGQDAARRWVVEGEAPRVESTFALIPGWDRAREGRADTEYDRGRSEDFSRYANVYRRWILNEDGRGEGAVFDLAGLFGQPGLPATGVALGNCLTMDDAGRPLPAVLELSLDAGVWWTRYAGAWRVLSGQAGVYLEDSALEAETLSAAKAGTLRVRVTGTLVSPRRREAGRWRGNPFGATGPEMRLNLATRYRFRRVAAGSLHDAAVRSGALQADEADDTADLTAELIRRLDQEDRVALTGQREALLTLHAARPELRVGDRVSRFTADGLDLQGEPWSVSGRSADVVSVRCEYLDRPQTRLMLRG
ncbi:MAG: hypothetical protein AAGG38_04215 [Planctomycetota bacterium]